MKPPAFQFYAADFLVGTATMTAEEVGAYMRLLCYQWDSGAVPDDDATICRLGGCQASAVARIRLKFRVTGDGLKNPRMEQERDKQRLYREKQAENGAKRWAGNAKPDATAMPSHEPNGCSPSPSPISDSGLRSPPSGSERREAQRSLPESLNTAPFRAAWEKWIVHFSASFARGGSVPMATADNHLELLRKLGPVRGVEAIENAITRMLREPAMPNSGHKPAPPERQRVAENVRPAQSPA